MMVKTCVRQKSSETAIISTHSLTLPEKSRLLLDEKLKYILILQKKLLFRKQNNQFSEIDYMDIKMLKKC